MSQILLFIKSLFSLKDNIRVMPQVSSLPVSRGLQNLVPAPPPSVPPPPDTPVSVVVQRPERSVEKEIEIFHSKLNFCEVSLLHNQTFR